MASQTGKKIRLVKCPKCLKILQEDEDVPIYQCGGCSAILQAKRRSISSNSTPSAVETERVQVQANEPRSEPETNIVSSNSGQDSVLPSSQGRSLDQEHEKKGSNASMESMEKELGALELINGDKTNEIQLGDAEKNEEEDNSKLESDMMMNTVGEVAESGANSGSLNVDHLVTTRASNSSRIAEISPDTSPIENKQSQLDVVATRSSDSSGNVEISPNTSPIEKKQSQLNVVAARSSDSSSGNVEISPDASPLEEKQSQLDDLGNKTSSAYDGSESSSDVREDQIFDENEEWNALQRIRSDKFEMHRYPGNYKEEGSSSSSTFFKNRRNGISAYNERYHNMSQQLDGPRELHGRQGRRYVSEQLRPDIPLYPREPLYTRGSPSYPSYDELDRYSSAHSLQKMGGMNHEFVDYTYQNNPRARGRGQRGWYSAQLHHNSYSSYSASPQRPMEPPEYHHPRWSHEIVSDVEDHQRNRYASHHQTRGLKERPPVAKRHVRPTAGGAPFVTCYSCSEHLHLPADFLIFKKKHHLLRCSTCSTVLRFSLQSNTHLVPAVTHNINANSTSESPRDKAPSLKDDETPEAKSSTLHLLMGYSTVSQVFKASKRPPF